MSFNQLALSFNNKEVRDTSILLSCGLGVNNVRNSKFHKVHPNTVTNIQKRYNQRGTIKRKKRVSTAKRILKSQQQVIFSLFLFHHF